MIPSKKFNRNKWRFDLSKYSKVFKKNKFEEPKKPEVTEPGKIYAIKYKIDNSILTDKYHVAPLVLSFGRFKGLDGKIYVRGVNLFYIDQLSLPLLDIAYEFYKKTEKDLDKRALEFFRLHEIVVKEKPYLLKNYEESRICSTSEIDSEEWGMIPLLNKTIFGNFELSTMRKDYYEELESFNKPRPRKKKKNELVKSEEIKTEEITFDNFDADDDEDY